MTLSKKYLDYMKSPEWKRRRENTITLADFRCQVCGGKAEQVHHNTYARFGHENQSDLIAVCKTCHRWITFFIRLRRWWKKLRGVK